MEPLCIKMGSGVSLQRSNECNLSPLHSWYISWSLYRSRCDFFFLTSFILKQTVSRYVATSCHAPQQPDRQTDRQTNKQTNKPITTTWQPIFGFFARKINSDCLIGWCARANGSSAPCVGSVGKVPKMSSGNFALWKSAKAKGSTSV